MSLCKFQLFKSGKAHVGACKCDDADSRKRSSVFEVTTFERYVDKSILYTASLAKAHELGYSVRNCLLCKHRRCNEGKDAYCDKSGIIIKLESHAIECPDYTFDNKKWEKSISSYNYLESHGELVVWEDELAIQE